jgi:hypothetical protein
MYGVKQLEEMIEGLLESAYWRGGDRDDLLERYLREPVPPAPDSASGETGDEPTPRLDGRDSEDQ